MRGAGQTHIWAVKGDVQHAQLPDKPGAADLIAPRIPPGRVVGLRLGWQFDSLNVALYGCRDAF